MLRWRWQRNHRFDASAGLMRPEQIYYFDNNATTRVAPEVISAMTPLLASDWGNPSSAYEFGRKVARTIDEARMRAAALIGASPQEIIFTSCGTESINSAMHSAMATQPEKRHVVTTSVEHSATANYCQYLQKRGYEVTFLPVEPDGSLDLHLLERVIRADTAMVSIMWANNETGVIFPVEEIAAICHSKGVLFHTDAVQVAGKLKIDVHGFGVDFLSLSAHKLHAPKGIGLLYVRPLTKYQPYMIGGHQEHGRRGGTENVPYIAGFGVACELALQNIEAENSRVRALRDQLEDRILKTVAHTSRNGAREPRLPNTSNIAFEGLEAEALLLALDQLGICASSGSACTTGSPEPSRVLTAMGLNYSRARGSVRFSFGIYNTNEDVSYLLEHLPSVVARLRKMAL
jgi:cysteine desulfurase